LFLFNAGHLGLFLIFPTVVRGREDAVQALLIKLVIVMDYVCFGSVSFFYLSFDFFFWYLALKTVVPLSSDTEPGLMLSFIWKKKSNIHALKQNRACITSLTCPL
jgi:hypothetical protein